MKEKNAAAEQDTAAERAAAARAAAEKASDHQTLRQFQAFAVKFEAK